MLLRLLLISTLAVIVHSKMQCLDDSGLPVDWYIFYKLPHLWDHPDNKQISNGTAFMYLDSNYKKWTLMQKGMDEPNNAVYYTLQQLYESDNSTTFSMMYNDEFPDSTVWSNNSGHCKGLTAFDKTSGFWLIHSIPKFPSADTWRFPSNAHYYGQHGLCISFPFASLPDIAQQLYFFDAFTYKINVPSYFSDQIPILNRLVKGEYQQSQPFSSIKNFKSLGGQGFKHFAKANAFGKDLYYDLVMPQLRTSIKVETWQHGNLNLPSKCGASDHQQVLNAEYIQLPNGVNFTNYNDHSKFVVAFNEVSSQPPLPYVCIGDINRQQHQMQRGGGTMCIYDQDLHFLYSTVISAAQTCPKQDMLRSNRVDVRSE